MRKYQYTFEFADNIEAAQKLCDSINARLTRYMRKHKSAHFTPWSAQDGSFDGYIVFYWR